MKNQPDAHGQEEREMLAKPVLPLPPHGPRDGTKTVGPKSASVYV